HPAVGRVSGDHDRAVVQRLALVDDLREIEVGHGAAALAARAHPAEIDRVLDDLLLAPGPGHHTAGLLGRDVEGERGRPADVRIPQPAEEDAQHRVRVRHRPHRRPRVRAEALLIDDDRGGEPFQDVDVGAGHRRHEPLDEGAVGLIDHPA
ncbi:hypothetical protein ABE10_02230, partial [Bacillus toyonensis]|nr:hypothetical protein [Bacillus toyonensis]